jgi:hypothetical protein
VPDGVDVPTEPPDEMEDEVPEPPPQPNVSIAITAAQTNKPRPRRRGTKGMPANAKNRTAATSRRPEAGFASAADAAVVVTVIINVDGVTPMLTVLGFALQAAPKGAPLQVMLAVPT